MNATDDDDVVRYAANALDEIRGYLEQALAATSAPLVLLRLALVRDDGDEQPPDHT